MDSMCRNDLKSTRLSHRYSLGTEECTEREIDPQAFVQLRRKSTIAYKLPLYGMENWRRVRILITATVKFIALLQEIRRFGTTRCTDYPVSENETQVVRGPKWIMRPDTTFVKVWTMLTSLVLVFSAFYTPYKVCMNLSYDASSFILDTFIDAWFGCDIILTFLTGFETEGGAVEMAPRRIAARYAKGWFVLDLMACFPFQVFNLDEAKEYNGLLRLLRLPRLYRLVRVFRVVKLMQSIGRYDLFETIMREVKVHSGILRLLKFSLMVITIVHVAGCFWFFLASIYDLAPGTWVELAKRENESTSDLYLISIYWVFTVITTVGFGDIVAANSLERVYSIVLMGFGIAFYAYTISNISSILTSMDQRNLEYKNRMAALKDFANETNLPKDLKDSVITQITHNYEANLDSWYTKDKLMSELPAHLRTQISLNVHQSLVSKFTFFQNKDPGFISFVIPKLKSVTYSIGELVYQAGDYASETFFLLSGEVILKDEDGVGFKTYVNGSYFGEIEVMRECLRLCTSQVISKKVECLVLSKDDLRQLMEEFPSVAMEMIEYAKSRSQRNQDAVRFARMTLNRSTRKRIAKRPSRGEAAENDPFWSILKRQFTKMNLIERRTRSGSTTPSTPMKAMKSSFSEIVSGDQANRVLQKSKSTSNASFPERAHAPPFSMSPVRRATDTDQSWPQTMGNSSMKKVTLPLPRIPSLVEEDLAMSSNRAGPVLCPEVESVLRDFDRIESALQVSISHAISKLIYLCKSQSDIDERLRAMTEKADDMRLSH